MLVKFTITTTTSHLSQAASSEGLLHPEMTSGDFSQLGDGSRRLLAERLHRRRHVPQGLRHRQQLQIERDQVITCCCCCC